MEKPFRLTFQLWKPEKLRLQNLLRPRRRIVTENFLTKRGKTCGRDASQLSCLLSKLSLAAVNKEIRI